MGGKPRAGRHAVKSGTAGFEEVFVHDPLGAFCKHGPQNLPGAGTGALVGLTFAAKDLFDVQGFVTGAGNPDWLDTHAPASETAPAVQKLLEEGATLLGKTVTDELAYSLSGENIHYGTPVNPAAPERIPGGSSSGSASAVAGDLVDFALGTDTSGSIRIPAGYCGLFGIRPTHGRVSCRGVVPLAPSFDSVGWMARRGALLLRAGEVLLGSGSVADLPEHLLFADDVFALADEPARELLQAAVAEVATLMRSVELITLSNGPLGGWLAAHNVLKDYEAWQTHGSWISSVKPRLAPEIEARFIRASAITEDQRSDALERQKIINARLRDLLQGKAVLCLPTAPGPAPFKHTPPEALESIRHRTLILTCIAGLGGLPQITLPLAAHRGCPLGLSLIGAPGEDESLLALARAIDEQGPRHFE
jgi:amidase